MAAYFERHNVEDPTDFKSYTEFITECVNQTGFSFPMTISEIPSFVDLNHHLNLNSSVFTYYLDDIYPLISNVTSKKSDQANLEEINLLLVYPKENKIENCKESKNLGHFMLIKNLSKFLSRRHSATSRTGKHFQKNYFLEFCVSLFPKFLPIQIDTFVTNA